jgi:hypothetical protein
MPINRRTTPKSRTDNRDIYAIRVVPTPEIKMILDTIKIYRVNSKLI